VLTCVAQAAQPADLPQPGTAFAFTGAGELRPGTLAVGGHRGRAPTSYECPACHDKCISGSATWQRYPWAWSSVQPSVAEPTSGKPRRAGRMGENVAGDARALRFLENTVRSFVEAARAGASFVEFDVQARPNSVCVHCSHGAPVTSARCAPLAQSGAFCQCCRSWAGCGTPCLLCAGFTPFLCSLFLL